MAEEFKLPPLDTVYHCTDPDRDLTLGEMLEGIDPKLVPTSDEMLDALLFSFGVSADD